jgi:hypothetical protein
MRPHGFGSERFDQLAVFPISLWRKPVTHRIGVVAQHWHASETSGWNSMGSMIVSEDLNRDDQAAVHLLSWREGADVGDRAGESYGEYDKSGLYFSCLEEMTSRDKTSTYN